jgi:hypothetical protein
VRSDGREMLLATSQLGAIGRFVGSDENGGYIESLQDGIKILVRLKNGVCMIKLWVRGGRLGQCG